MSEDMAAVEALEKAADALMAEAKLMRDMARRMDMPWTPEREAKTSGYREAASLVRGYAAALRGELP